jgi:DNA-directed RNA polymerase subunit beta
MKYFPKQRYFGKHQEIMEVPDLAELQIKSYEEFLQYKTPSICREDKGLQSLIQEFFPIDSYNQKYSLEFVGYELGKPRYSLDECRELKLTYGAPFKIRVRLINKTDESKVKEEEEEVFLGEIPLMIGGGEFIINGAERVIVSQLHRSPGVDFEKDDTAGEKRLHKCLIIPERGSWIDVTVTRKDTLVIQIDKNGKFPVTSFLRALDEAYSTDEAILKLFYDVENISIKAKDRATAPKKLLRRYLAAPLTLKVDSTLSTDDEKELILPAGIVLEEAEITRILDSDIKTVPVLKQRVESDIQLKENTAIKDKSLRLDTLILKTLEDDPTSDRSRDIEKEPDGYRAALAKLYSKLRSGNPFNFEKAKGVLNEKFKDPARYRLGRVGRFRLNRKFRQNVDPDQMALTPDDLINSIRYIMLLRDDRGEIDDIDHLGNRRIRTITELAGEEFRKGFSKLKRHIQEKMNVETDEQLSPKTLINPKTISAAIEYFFGRGELSQVVDQTNPLAQLTHERRLSALGPGGLNRKRAGFDVRDVHISHYGRICPIETPEGANIGLISSLSIYSSVDEYGFLQTPYRVVKDGKLTNEIKYLRADEEQNQYMTPSDVDTEADGTIKGSKIMVRYNSDYRFVDPHEINYCDISSKQMVGVSAALIPFLEHDDANRALMGSNMQRQAVPLVRTEPPIVATGMEEVVARNSSMVIRSEFDGTVLYSDGRIIRIQPDDPEEEVQEYTLRKFVGLNERTCLNQKTIVKEGEHVKKGQVIADGAATRNGELALGKNVLVAFMPWGGYNYEDAIIVSEKLVRDDYYTSIHIDEFDAEIRETKLGREEFTRDIPNVAERALQNLDENGVVRVGTMVHPGDILVGKVTPKTKSESTPEEKLLHAIFGRAGEDVKNDSKEVPSGVEGIVIRRSKFTRKVKNGEENKDEKEELKRLEEESTEQIYNLLKKLHQEIIRLTGVAPVDKKTGQTIKWREGDYTPKNLKNLKERLNLYNLQMDEDDEEQYYKLTHLVKKYMDKISEIEDQKSKRTMEIINGHELPIGVLELVKVYIATKRVLSVGDKMAGRHGNKGVISRVLPEEDMPFLEDGTPIEIILNPLGVPSRMNVGQILETHLGWAAHALGFQAITPVFDGCSEEEINENLKKAGLPTTGTTTLYDGRTGEPFNQKITVGYIYMLKLHHLVEDKVHARSTGPYSLITQQPLGGKARSGGQRFGEMEVWALEAYGAANILQELLTVKSDDLEGRNKIYESMVKGKNTLEPGTPVSFEVLMNEIKGLALDMQLHKKKTAVPDDDDLD